MSDKDETAPRVEGDESGRAPLPPAVERKRRDPSRGHDTAEVDIEAAIAAEAEAIPKSPDVDSSGDETTAVLRVTELEAERLHAAAYLTVLSGSRVGEMMKIDEELTLGRDEDVGFRLVDAGVSRQHLKLVPDSGGVMAYDLDSQNGTFINGKRVSARLLEDGDKIQLGSTAIIKFAYADRLEQSFQQRMYDAAVRDALTGLHNRRHLLAQLQVEFAHVARHGSPLAAIMMDLDHFKSVNDTHGHAVGDAVLVGFAEYLTSRIRNEDVAARYGGEEFVLVCRGIRGPVGLAVANRLREGLATVQLCSDYPDLEVTISAGVAAIPDPRYGDPAKLLDAADKALYAAKEAGRNCARLAE